MAKKPESASSEPFVSQQDRPNVHADTPLSELRVRDLQTILAHKTIDKQIKEVEKNHYKDLVDKVVEKNHFKESSDNTKFFKDLRDDLPIPKGFEIPSPDPRQGDPINQIAQTLTGLQNAVSQLANEVEQLKAKTAKG
jgi:hypothetical protein